MKKTYPLAVFSPVMGHTSETFIRRFMCDLLPGQTAVIAKHWAEGASVWTLNGPALVLNRLPKLGLKRQVLEALAWQIGMELPGQVETAITRFLKENGVRVMLSNYLDESLPYLEIARKLGIRFIAHGHGYDISERLRSETWRKAYLKLEQADGIVVVSESIRQRLVASGLSASRIHVIPCSVDVPSSFIARAEKDVVRCVAVGRMCSKKAPVITLDTFRRAQAICPQLRLDYIGDGELMPAAIQFVKALKLEDIVTLHGAQSVPVVANYLQHADIFLQHSMVDALTGDEEGLPVAVLEAMARGLPVVSTRHAGIPEAVEDGVTGLLVDEGDSAGMSEHIVRLTQSLELRRQMGLAGWKRAGERFSWEREKQALLKLMGFE